MKAVNSITILKITCYKISPEGTLGLVIEGIISNMIMLLGPTLRKPWPRTGDMRYKGFRAVLSAGVTLSTHRKIPQGCSQLSLLAEMLQFIQK